MDILSSDYNNFDYGSLWGAVNTGIETITGGYQQSQADKLQAEIEARKARTNMIIIASSVLVVVVVGVILLINKKK